MDFLKYFLLADGRKEHKLRLADEKEIKEWITSKGISYGKIMQPLRLCLVGKLAGPHLFDIIYLIGKTETIKRIENAIENI